MNELVKLTKIVKQSIEKSHDDSNFFSFVVLFVVVYYR